MSRHIRVMAASLLIAASTVAFIPSGYVSAVGITNPGFELGEGADPYGWDPAGNAARVDTGPIYSGSWAARLTGEGDMLTQWIDNIVPMVTYEFWGWIYASGDVRGEIWLDFWAGKEGRQLTRTTMLSADDTRGDYVQRSEAIYAPQGTTHLRIRLRGIGWTGVGEVRFDELGFYAVRMLCSIATAAYGTATASQLDVLRDFRDQVLLGSALGSQLVAAYYRVSPAVADFLMQDGFLRAVVREILIDPLVNLLLRSQDLWRHQTDTP